MRKYLVASMILASLGTFGVVGCDKTVDEKTSTTKAPDGSSSTAKEKTVEHSDGSTTTKTESKSTDVKP